jgi:hypothetical protein
MHHVGFWQNGATEIILKQANCLKPRTVRAKIKLVELKHRPLIH